LTDIQRQAQQEADFDASQFKLQSDGTFRISVRGMAAMAGIDDNGLGRSLKSAADENPLPCSRSLLAQGFCPADVTSWSATGGIPEDAAPFILEHYAFTAKAPSKQARAVLLAFSRVGINAYLKDRLGMLKRESAPTALAPAEALDIIERSIGLLERLGVMDERDCLQMGDMVRNVNARAAGGMLLAPASADDEEITLSDAWLEVTGTPLPRGKAPSIGRLIAEQYREEFQQEPPTRTQFVDGAPRKVKSYRRNFLIQAVQETWAKFVA